MKAISEKKIIDLIHSLENSNYDMPEWQLKGIIDTLKDVLTCEQSSAKVGKIDLQQYTGDRYPGVMHSEGRMIATDGYHLISLAADYPEELEGQTIGKDGKDAIPYFSYGKFPRWQSVVPNVEGWNKYCIDFDRLTEIVTEARAHKKIYKKNQVARVMIDEGICFDLWQLDKFARVMKSVGINTAHAKAPEKYNGYPLTVKSEPLIAVLQPCMPPEADQMDDPNLFLRRL